MKSKDPVRNFWRSHYPQYRSSLIQASVPILKAITTTSEFKQATHIGLYYPLAWEISLLDLFQVKGPRYSFPKCDIESITMAFYPISEAIELVPGPFGIKEPEGKGSEVRPDLLLIPGLGFDKAGGRVGSGKGFYDRYLERQKCLKWGICLSAQVLDENLAQNETDVRMDALITENGFIKW